MNVRSVAVLATALMACSAGARAEGRVDVRIGGYVGPPRGTYVREVPRESFHVGWRGGHYWYHGGVWYRPIGGRYVVIAPPVGAIVPVLPPAYDLRVYGGTTYYHANGAYYAAVPGQGYVVTDVPPGGAYAPDAAVVATAPVAPAYGAQSASPYAAPAPAQAAPTGPPPQPIVYPRNGQSPDQTGRDRADCARWATGQAAGTSGPDVYLRAFDACMDGRGYTVR